MLQFSAHILLCEGVKGLQPPIVPGSAGATIQ
jgi:hypothetical protein